MNYIIYINNKRIELSKSARFKRTLQINDINSLTSRNSNMTTSIDIDLTNHVNSEAFEDLGVIGSTSNLPYIKMPFMAFTDSGFSIIRKGVAVIQNVTENNLKLSLYDGYIDFFDAVNSVTFPDIDISELNHGFSIFSVIESFNNNGDYRYLLGSYDGTAGVDLSNQSFLSYPVEYQVPSVRGKYLFEKIMSHLGYTFEGDIFSQSRYLDWYISYPNGFTFLDDIESITIEQTLSGSRFLPDALNNQFININGNNPYPYPRNYIAATFNDDCVTRVEVAGRLFKSTDPFDSAYHVLLRHYDSNDNVKFEDILTTEQFGGEFFDRERLINAKNGDKLSFDLVDSSDINNFTYLDPVNYNRGDIETTLDLQGVGEIVDFNEGFSQMTPSQFIKEMLVRFALTPIVNEADKHIRFLSIKNRVEAKKEDWSNIFIRRTNRNFNLKGYAQRNIFRFDYKEDEIQSIPNGNLLVNNQNIEFEKEVFKSQTENPEFDTYNNWHNFETYTYETASETKPNEDNFYFHKSQLVNKELNLGSFNTAIKIDKFYQSVYTNCRWSELLSENYTPYIDIFDKAEVIEVEVWMDEVMYVNFDFEIVVHIKQLSSDYLVNKVKFIDVDRPAIVELIKIK